MKQMILLFLMKINKKNLQFQCKILKSYDFTFIFLSMQNFEIQFYEQLL